MTPQEALRRIDSLEKFGIDLGLYRIARCLRALGSPEQAFPAVHVAGTNGKGSTCAFVASVLREAGHRVGLYTSPPLERFGERIRVDGHELPETAVPGLLEAVDRAGPGLTQFEVITAMALLHFARQEVDVAVVEVGLGGRLDATNVVRPAVSAVTNVGLEHTEHLGPTVAAIAVEKAGIARPGVPLVTGAGGEALEAVQAEAARRGAPVRALGRDFRVTSEGPGKYRYRGRAWDLAGLAPGLAGAYQAANLAVALAALEALAEGGWDLPEAAVRSGVAGASWPGRLEVLGRGPRVVLDGAHNPHASRALARALREGLEWDRLWLVLGILGDKDARSIVEDLVPLAHRVIVTRSASARALEPGALAGAARDAAGARAVGEPTVAGALDRALAAAGPADLVCVTGSLTVVGEARAHLRALGWIR